MERQCDVRDAMGRGESKRGEGGWWSDNATCEMRWGAHVPLAIMSFDPPRRLSPSFPSIVLP